MPFIVQPGLSFLNFIAIGLNVDLTILCTTFIGALLWDTAYRLHEFFLVTSLCTGRTDRQTDGSTDGVRYINNTAYYNWRAA